MTPITNEKISLWMDAGRVELHYTAFTRNFMVGHVTGYLTPGGTAWCITDGRPDMMPAALAHLARLGVLPTYLLGGHPEPTPDTTVPNDAPAASQGN